MMHVIRRKEFVDKTPRSNVLENGNKTFDQLLRIVDRYLPSKDLRKDAQAAVAERKRRGVARIPRA